MVFIPRRILFVSAVLAFVCSEGLAAGELAPDAYQAALAELFPKEKATVHRDQHFMAGSLGEGDKKLSFRLIAPFGYEVGGKHYAGVYVQFHESEMRCKQRELWIGRVFGNPDAFRALRAAWNDKLVKPRLDNFALVGEVDDARLKSPRRIVLDPDAFAVLVTGPFAVDDHIGNGGLQVMAESNSYYFIEDPPEQVEVYWRRLYELPSWRPLFRGVAWRGVTSTVLSKTARKTPISFAKAEDGKPRNILIDNEQTGKRTVVPFKDGKYDYDPGKPWLRTVKERQQQAEDSRFELKLRAVDESGKPLAGVRVLCVTAELDLKNWRHQPDIFTGKTDAKGELVRKCALSAQVQVTSPGRYPYRAAWVVGAGFVLQDQVTEPPKDWVIVKMEKAPVPVSVFRDGAGDALSRGWREWEKGRQIMGIGVVLSPGAENKDAFTTDRKKAHLWIEVDAPSPPPGQLGTPEAQAVSRGWSMTVEGLNGWELAQGPAKIGTAEVDQEGEKIKMREAPEKGYSKKLSYTVGTCPQGL